MLLPRGELVTENHDGYGLITGVITGFDISSMMNRDCQVLHVNR